MFGGKVVKMDSREVAQTFGEMVRPLLDREQAPAPVQSWPRRAASAAGGFLLGALGLAALLALLAAISYAARLGWDAA